MKLILVRHGHTNDLKRRIVQGHRPVPLNALGRQQAERLAKSLHHFRFSRIITSDSPRAVQTAMAIAKYHPRVKIERSAQLREKSSGVYEGRRFTQLSPYVVKRIRHLHWRPRKGESQADLFLRTKQWYRAFRRQHHRGTVLVVSHGGFLRSLLTLLFHGSRMQFRTEYSHDNTGVTIVKLRGTMPRLLQLNDTSHLGHRH